MSSGGRASRARYLSAAGASAAVKPFDSELLALVQQSEADAGTRSCRGIPRTCTSI